MAPHDVDRRLRDALGSPKPPDTDRMESSIAEALHVERVRERVEEESGRDRAFLGLLRTSQLRIFAAAAVGALVVIVLSRDGDAPPVPVALADLDFGPPAPELCVGGAVHAQLIDAGLADVFPVVFDPDDPMHMAPPSREGTETERRRTS